MQICINFLVTFKILQDGDEVLFNQVLWKGLKLLEMDALGGSGSRGYGRIAFEGLKLDGKSKTLPDNPFSEECKET